MTRRNFGNLGCLFSVAVMVFLCAGGLMPSRARRALPWSASDVHEYHWEPRDEPDFMHSLSARMTKAEFQAFIERLDLDQVYSKPEHAELPIIWHGPGGWAEWWNPPDSLDGAYFHFTNDDSSYHYMIAKYEDGRMHCCEFKWVATQQ